MIEEYINNIIQNRVPEDKGYNYITTETILIPVYKVTLVISKRHITNLELVEEMILRLSSIGITNLDTIAGTLGLPRDIIDITVGDLHLKNLAFHSSGNCILMAKGRESLKSLSVTNREKDVLHNVFVDAITGEIYGKKEKHYKEESSYNATKMKHICDANKLEFYRRNMDSIREIFNQSANTYLDNHMKVQDELVSIDAVENVTTGFIDTPIHIYVSDKGYEIDVIAQRRSQRQFLDDHKDAIIEQLRNRKLLPHITSFCPDEHTINPADKYTSRQKVYDQLYELTNVSDNFNFEEKANKILFSSRVLFDNELLDFCNIAFTKSNKIEIYIDNLNYWSKNYKFLTICSFIKKGTVVNIYYSNAASNINYPIKRIKYSCPSIDENQFVKLQHENWFKIIIDSKLSICNYYESVKVFSDNRYIKRKESILLIKQS